MKSILATLLLLTVTVANSATTVQVVWPFSPSSSQSVMARDLIESANKSQDKYQFVFINKPGAGGSIAANYTLNRPELTLMISSNSFWLNMAFGSLHLTGVVMDGRASLGLDIPLINMRKICINSLSTLV